MYFNYSQQKAGAIPTDDKGGAKEASKMRRESRLLLSRAHFNSPLFSGVAVKIVTNSALIALFPASTRVKFFFCFN